MGALLEILRGAGRMNFARFMEMALYAPSLGYYSRKARRVGTGPDADFATAESLGNVFFRMAAAGAANVADGWMKKGAVLVEMGAEPGADSIANHASPPFALAVALARGEAIPSDAPVVLASNELFDAQPFHRLVRRGGTWRECGAEVVGDRVAECLMDSLSPEVEAFAGHLPPDAPEGARLDLPLAAEKRMAEIAAQGNVVALVAFDYGLDWADILYRRPSGTARAYRSQRLVEDLYADPGEQDLTCHVAWDGLEAVLRSAGFSVVKTQSQEAFFMHNAFAAMTKILSKADPVECGKLRELIHPMRMGSAFQVLSAVR